MPITNSTTTTDNTRNPAEPATDRPATGRSVTVHRYGTPDVLTVEQIEIGELDADRVRIDVKAASINPIDWYQLSGTPRVLRLMFGLRRPKDPRIGGDVSGVVTAVGSDTTRFAIGDEVFGSAAGSCANSADAREGLLVHKPTEVSFEAAGVTAIAGVTALQAVLEYGEVGPGTRLLINGAAGGVGTFAVQIAKAVGAHVTAVCSTRNVDMVRRLGADRVIDYTSDDFVDGTRYDVIVDNAGNRSYRDCKRSLVPGGHYVMVGAPKGGRLLGPVTRMMTVRLAFAFAKQQAHTFMAEINVERLDRLAAMMRSAEVTPEIERVYGLDDIAEAFTLLGTSHARAKLAVVPEPA